MFAQRNRVFYTISLFAGIIVKQNVFVAAAPQFAMRPNLHVYGVEATESNDSVVYAATAAAEVSGTNLELAVPTTVNTAATQITPDAATVTSFSDTGTLDDSQTSSASQKYGTSLAAVAFGLGLAALQAL